MQPAFIDQSMILILAHAQDEAAQWLFNRLSSKHSDILLLSDLDLLEATQWFHYLSNDKTETSFHLKNGQKIELGNVEMVINRLQYIYPVHWAGSSDKERNYAQQEYHAFFASWLLAFKGVLYNPPTVNTLCGTNPGKIVWLSMAKSSGFRIPENSFYVNSDNNIFDDILFRTSSVLRIAVVLDDEVINAPPAFENACLRLSRKSNLPLLCIYFIKDQTSWLFAGATPLPDFRLLPPEFLVSLHKKINAIYAEQ